jgi:hypothetical protein
MLIDPKFHQDFYNTPNEERTTAELDAFWDKPFAITNDDGTFDVHCLDGGAWDRPTWYGAASTLAAAESLGEKKLAKWKQSRAQPMSVSEGEKILIVRMPQRPDGEHEILKVFDSEADAAAFLSSLM